MKKFEKEEVKLVEKVICVLAMEHKDEDVLIWLKYLGRLYQAEINAIKNDKALPAIIAQNDLIAPIRKEFLDKIQALYWRFPNTIDLKESIEGHDPQVYPYHKHKATLIESKKWILKQVMDAWYVGDTSEWCVDLLRFVVKAYTPKQRTPISDLIEQTKAMGEDIKKLSDEELEYRARKWKVFKVEQDNILALLRGRLEQAYSGACESWLRLIDFPEEIAKIFAIARVRSGGKELIMRDIRNVEFCRKFELK